MFAIFPVLLVQKEKTKTIEVAPKSMWRILKNILFHEDYLSILEKLFTMSTLCLCRFMLLPNITSYVNKIMIDIVNESGFSQKKHCIAILMSAVLR